MQLPALWKTLVVVLLAPACAQLVGSSPIGGLAVAKGGLQLRDGDTGEYPSSPPPPPPDHGRRETYEDPWSHSPKHNPLVPWHCLPRVGGPNPPNHNGRRDGDTGEFPSSPPPRHNHGKRDGDTGEFPSSPPPPPPRLGHGRRDDYEDPYPPHSSGRRAAEQ